ncbi:hypothetical protein [Streptomyces sp. NBC_00145]|uniref:hypothetical protein n=1 Tax=Streptomyces sp. NBC_00145 TaxID=2975666 RepID=UPI002E17317F
MDFTAPLVKATRRSTPPDAWVDAYYVEIRKQTPPGPPGLPDHGHDRLRPHRRRRRRAQKKHADLYTEIGRIPQKADVSKQFDPSVTNDFNAALAAAQKG